MYKIIFIALILLSNQAFSASKCEHEWNAFKKVQDQLRQKSTQWLRDKEHRKHNEYQHCRQGKSKKSKAEKTKIKKYKSKNVVAYQKPKVYKQYNSKYSGQIKGLFTGKKQKAWIQYYKRPNKCLIPKSIPLFSKCLKHRNDAADKFDIQWRMNNAPSPIKINIMKGIVK